ncbi:MAG: hypothetical protein ACRC10_06090 [Thermoguttaceae bacterium]
MRAILTIVSAIDSKRVENGRFVGTRASCPPLFLDAGKMPAFPVNKLFLAVYGIITIIAVFLLPNPITYAAERGIGMSVEQGKETNVEQGKGVYTENEKGTNVADFFRTMSTTGRRIDVPLGLETSILRLENEEQALSVDLITAIHLGDAEYFRELNERFKEYEVVLFELLLPENTTINQVILSSQVSDTEENFLARYQNSMTEVLGLVHQLDHINYRAPNFVHADMSSEEFMRRVKERGELKQTVLRALNSNFADRDYESSRQEGRLWTVLISDAKSSALTLKRHFALALIEQMEESIWILSGDEGSTILDQRNSIVLDRLKEQIELGKKRIAIFYGGAHLPGLAQNLKNDFGMKEKGKSWILAWDISVGRNLRKVGD